MKKHLIVIGTAVLLLAVGLSGCNEYEPFIDNLKYKDTISKIVINGNLSDWPKELFISDIIGDANPSSDIAEYGMCLDNKNIYLAVKFADVPIKSDILLFCFDIDDDGKRDFHTNVEIPEKFELFKDTEDGAIKINPLNSEVKHQEKYIEVRIPREVFTLTKSYTSWLINWQKDSTDHIKMELKGLSPCRFNITKVNVTNPKILSGLSTTIMVTITNSGEELGTYEVELKINNELTSEQNITICGGENKTISFIVEKDDVGIYDVDVNDVTTVFEVVDFNSLSNALEIHQDAWEKMAESAKDDYYWKYGLYGSRTLAVTHPELYLLGDRLFLEEICTKNGFKKCYETNDVHSDYMYEKKLTELPFSFDSVNFSTYKIVNSSGHYQKNYPFIGFIDKRMLPIATTLKVKTSEITQLEKIEQLYFKEIFNGISKQSLFIIYCDNENTYLYENGKVLNHNFSNTSMKGNPILIFNEYYVWYPLMNRNDTSKSNTLKQIVASYTNNIDVPQLNLFEEGIITNLRNNSKLYSKTSSQKSNEETFAAVASITPSTNILQDYNKPPFRGIMEYFNYNSPIAAFLASIVQYYGGKEGIEKMTEEFIKQCSYNSDTVHGHAWFCGTIEPGLEFTYLTKAGHCVVQSGNVGTVLRLAKIDSYRLGGTAGRIGEQNEGGHDFIYVPKYDLIISNGVIFDGVPKYLEHNTAVCWDDNNADDVIATLVTDEGWANIQLNGYGGTLSPLNVLYVLEFLREIHGDDIKGLKNEKGVCTIISFEDLKNGLQKEQSNWHPYELPKGC